MVCCKQFQVRQSPLLAVECDIHFELLLHLNIGRLYWYIVRCIKESCPLRTVLLLCPSKHIFFSQPFHNVDASVRYIVSNPFRATAFRSTHGLLDSSPRICILQYELQNHGSLHVISFGIRSFPTRSTDPRPISHGIQSLDSRGYKKFCPKCIARVFNLGLEACILFPHRNSFMFSM